MPKGHIYSAPTVIHPLNTCMVMGRSNSDFLSSQGACFQFSLVLGAPAVGRAPTGSWQGVGCKMGKRRPHSRAGRQAVGAWGLAVNHKGAGIGL